MRASEKCLSLIQKFEGFMPAPYLCPAGVPTIGFGNTRYADDTPVKLTDPAITLIEATALLYATLGQYEAAVNRYAKVPLNQNQFDALTDFAFNAGAQNLRTSTLLKKLNAGDYAGASAEFGRWVYGGGKKLNGLVRRRAAEQSLFDEVMI